MLPTTTHPTTIRTPPRVLFGVVKSQQPLRQAFATVFWVASNARHSRPSATMSSTATPPASIKVESDTTPTMPVRAAPSEPEIKPKQAKRKPDAMSGGKSELPAKQTKSSTAPKGFEAAMRECFGAADLTKEGIAKFFLFVRAQHDANILARIGSVYYPPDMTEAFMGVAMTKLLTQGLARVVSVLAQAVNTPPFVQNAMYPIGNTYVHAFEHAFRDTAAGWHSLSLPDREALFKSYSGLLDVTAATTEAYFDFVKAGAKCFDPAFFPGVAELDGRSYDARYAEVVAGLSVQPFDAKK